MALATGLSAQVVTPVESSAGRILDVGREPIVHSPLVQQFNYGLNPRYQRDGWTLSSSLLQTSFNPRFFTGIAGEKQKSREKATFDLGPLAINLHQWRTELIASDNVDADAAERSGWVARSSLGAEVNLYLSDNFFLRVAGTITWLPLVNKIGLNGFDLNDRLGDRGNLAANLGLGNNFSLGWRGEVGAWDVLVFNALQNEWMNASWQATADASLSYSVWDPVTFEAIDRAGRYAFGASGRSSGLPDQGDANFESVSRSLDDRENRALRNTTGATFGRDISTVEARFELSVSNTYEWREDPVTEETNETRTQGVTASLVSVRENLRFRPFVVGKVFRRDDQDWLESVSAGVTAPLTDQVSMIASAGYVRRPDDAETTTYRLGLRHVAGPYTVHSASFRREIYDDDRVRTTVDYRLSQMLGSRLTGTFLYVQGENEYFSGAGRVSEDETIALQFSLLINPQFWVNLTALNNRQRTTHANNPQDNLIERYQLRVQAIQDFKSSGRLSVTYVYDDVSGGGPHGGYNENAMFVTYERDL